MTAPRSNLLMVEGKDDLHVVAALCKRYEVPELFRIRGHDGVEAMLQAFPERLDESDRQRLGIVIDADPDVGVARRWASVTAHLQQRDYPGVPRRPDRDGTILGSPGPFLPVVGIWLMPDNDASGTLEHFLRFLVPEGDRLLPRAEAAVRRLPLADRRFSPAHRTKAELHTWLAWQENPGVPFGTAITARYLDAGVPQAQAFVDWLRRLFVTPPGTSL